MWDDISGMNDLTTIDSTGEQINLYEGGIHVASRGMPTGISLNPPVTGSAGYWPNFYIVLEDDSIVFDLGRKSIPGRTQGLLKDIARNLFNEFLPFREYVRTDPAISRISTVQQFEKQRQFNEFRQLPDVSIDKINILKHPDGQEAGVVALFHELVGAGILKGYYTLQRGYKMTYDLWGIYRIGKDEVGSNFRGLSDDANLMELPIVLEFKFRAESILRDLENNRKFFTDMDLIVCWDLNESEFAKQGVKVELLQAEDRFFYGSNYKLIWPGAYNLGSASEKPVLALRKFVQDYVTNS
jgi:hypothetical protein